MKCQSLLRNVLSMPTALSIAILVGGSAISAGQQPSSSSLANQQRTPLPSTSEMYKLHPGDEITVEYRLSPEYNASITVQPDGYVSLPLIGSTDVEGLTVPAAAEAIRKAAAVRLNDPEVNVQLKSFEKPYVTVTGEVVTPGKVEFHPSLSALRAITLAGGFRNDSAEKSHVLLIRPISSTMGETHVLDIKRLMDSKYPEDFELRPGDMLIVSQNRFTKVSRVVRLLNPGIYVPLSASY